MDIGKIKEIAKRMVTELFNNPVVLKDLCTPDFIARHSWGDEYIGVKAVVALMRKTRRNTLDRRVIIDDCFAEDKSVALRFRVSFPRVGGGEVLRNEIAILRFKGDKISEFWGAYDRQVEKEQRAQL